MSSASSCRIALITSVGLKVTQLIVDGIRHFFFALDRQLTLYIMVLLKLKLFRVPFHLLEASVAFKNSEGFLTNHDFARKIRAQHNDIHFHKPAVYAHSVTDH